LTAKPYVSKRGIRVKTRVSPAKPDDPANSRESYLLAADFFTIFSDSIALMIWHAVRKKEMSARAVAKKLRVAARLASKTLQALEQKGFLVANTRSQTIYYRVADSTMAQAFTSILELADRNQKANRQPWRNPSAKPGKATGHDAIRSSGHTAIRKSL
jgi:ribosomal protein S25